MDYSSVSFLAYFILLLLVPINRKPLIPAMFMFGDSLVDVGNNNLLFTPVKANFLPFGKDFVNHYPTGRFTNGKLTIDFASEAFGFSDYQPAYLNLYVKGKNILNGANFASGGSGYHESSSIIYHTLSMDSQLDLYKDYQKQLMRVVGKSDATSIISNALYVVCAGNGDFSMNYYFNPFLQTHYTPQQFADILVQNYAKFIKNLYALGARKIGVATLSAIGCLPTIIHWYGSSNRDKCVGDINNVAIYFNEKLNSTSLNLQNKFPGLKLALLDGYHPLYDLANKPSEYGFSESRKGCYQVVGVSLCPNASEYVFWDGFHPTEAANKFLAAELIAQSTPLIS